MTREIHASPMKVLHIISGDIWAGAEVQAYSLICGYLRMNSCKVQAITFNEGVLASKLREKSIPVSVLDERKLSRVSISSACLQVMRTFKPHIVHTHGFKENFLGGIAARLGRVEGIIRTHHGRGMIGSAGRYDMIERINAWILTDAAIAVSHDLEKFLIELGIPAKKITVIHNGVEPCEHVLEDKAKALRMELGIANDERVIGAIGRLVPIKDHRTFINSAKLILEAELKVRFVLVGDGHLRDDLEQQVRNLGIDRQFCFTGFREDANDLLDLFDVFVLTSIHEGIPIALLEAMSLGKPVVVTCVGGIPEVVKDHVNGMMVPSGDVKAFADACLRVLRDDVLRASLSEHAYREVREKYLLDATVERTQNVYRKARAV